VVGLPRSPGLAIAALACGIAGIPLCFFLIPSVLAIVFGLVAESQIRNRPATVAVGRGLARTGWILGIVGVLGFAVFVWAVATDRIDTDDGEVSVFSLDVGECIDLGAVPAGGDEQVQRLPERSCDEPHDGEVYAVDDVSLDGDEYPGVAVIQENVAAACSGSAFEDYVSSDFGASELDTYYLYPIADGWERGDREYVCVAVTVDGSKLTETVRDSGR